MDQNGTRYDRYRMSPEEFSVTLLLSAGFFFAIGLLFYENLYISLALAAIGILYIPRRKKNLIAKRKDLLKLQFRDALYFISVSLSAGKSFETALADAENTLGKMYPDRNADILKELGLINARIMMNITVESALNDFAARSGIEEIRNFADVFSISKRAGVNLIEVIKNTSSLIREKIEVKNEIANYIAGKKLEQKILSLTPFVLVFFLKSTSSDFLLPLFTTLQGRAAMTVALLLLLAGYLISKKIMDIEV